MGLRVYNTLSRKKEDFETIEPGKVRMYVCGVTVYNKAHMGHAMFALVFDIIRRYLEYSGYEVRHVMNFTDVDDKIILRASQLGVDPFELAESYIREFQKNLSDLNIKPPTVAPRATREIPQIINMIKELGENDYAYEVDGDVYFRVLNDPDYGKLSGRKLDDMQAGARIDVDQRKEHPMDFALWKSAKPGEPAWESPWGKGRPGWHIECSAMNMHHLGEQIDVHGGGNDLVFPHHENEIAQTESLTGKPFVRYWIHNGMLQVGGEKMAKTLGNFITIDDFLAKHSADAMRLIILNSGYRGPVTFNDDVIEQAERGLERLHSALRPELPGSKGAPAAAVAALDHQIEAARSGFKEAMDDDFNTAGALGVLFELVRVINQTRADGATDAELKPAQDVLRELTGVYGLQMQEAGSAENTASAFIDLLVELRTDLRRQKLYAIGDQIRDRLAKLGVVLEDSKEGTTWRWSM
jgi:cysteinyl-tRNA synthetase